MIQSVKRAFDILEYITQNGNLVRLNDIASALELQNTTVHNFLNTLKEKIVKKSLIFPDEIPLGLLRKIKTLKDFDDFYTGPIHGFKDAHDYYEKNSSLYFIDQIEIPTLILNAQNDPFLSEKCFPVNKGKSLPNIWMEFPKHGGHVGFSPRNRSEIYWSEKRAFEFINADL